MSQAIPPAPSAKAQRTRRRRIRVSSAIRPAAAFTAGFDHATLNTGGVNHGLACSTCHDGMTATGKTRNHVPTSRDCINCHAGYPPTASSFAGGTFNHTGPEMTGQVHASCHNDSIAGGWQNELRHVHAIATNSDCGACHSTTTFTSATGFNHTGVTTGCAASGCHTSGTAERGRRDRRSESASRTFRSSTGR